MVYIALWVSQNKMAWSAIDHLLLLMRLFFGLFGQSDIFPMSFNKLLQKLHASPESQYVERGGKISMANLKQVMCSKCKKCYLLRDCYVKDANGQVSIRVCKNPVFQTLCNQPLLITVPIGKNKTVLRPLPSDTFLFPGIIDQLPRLLRRPEIKEVTHSTFCSSLSELWYLNFFSFSISDSCK